MRARCVCNRVLSEPPDWNLRDHALALGEVGDTRSETCNRPGNLKARRKWKRGFELILAADDQQIRKVQPRRVHANQDLPLTGLRTINLIDAKIARSTPLMSPDGFHSRSSPPLPLDFCALILRPLSSQVKQSKRLECDSHQRARLFPLMHLRAEANTSR